MNRAYFRELSIETGFQVDILEKVYRLCHILITIQDHPELRKKLVLKGGTAINFIYFDI